MPVPLDVSINVRALPIFEVLDHYDQGTTRLKSRKSKCHFCDLFLCFYSLQGTYKKTKRKVMHRVCDVPGCLTTKADIDAEMAFFLASYCQVCRRDRYHSVFFCVIFWENRNRPTEVG